MKETLLIGASENPERYAYKAIKALLRNGHSVKAIARRPGTIDSVDFETEKILFENIDTVTLYISAVNQTEYLEYIKEIHPRRVIFNPGTENTAFEGELAALGVEVERACTLVLLATDQY